MTKTETNVTEFQARVISNIKSAILFFFSGDDLSENVHFSHSVPIHHTGITGLEFNFVCNDKIELKFHTIRPGFIIGKGGRTIDALKEHINSWIKDHGYEVTIHIYEDKLWDNTKQGDALSSRVTIEHYQNVLRLAGVPEILIKNPLLIKSIPPTLEDIEWAKKMIKKRNDKNG